MKEIYKIGEFAKLLGVSQQTLRNWDKKGILKPIRSYGNTRYYSHEQYLSYIGKEPNVKEHIIIYARVSSRNQKDDLENQVEFLKTWANAKGYIIDDIQTDIGSGLNYKRKNWNKIIYNVLSGNKTKVIVSHKDRFIRFGFDWFEELFVKYNSEIIVVKNEKLSPESELVDDIVSILHVFSCRLYGLRKYKKEIEKDSKNGKIESI